MQYPDNKKTRFLTYGSLENANGSVNQLCPQCQLSFDGWHQAGYTYALGVRSRAREHG